MYNQNSMRVLKRNGEYQDVSFDKILARARLLCCDPNLKRLEIDPTIIAQKVCSEIFDGVTTQKLDELSSEIAIAMYSKHPDYAELASRLVISNHQKMTSNKFSELLM